VNDRTRWGGSDADAGGGNRRCTSEKEERTSVLGTGTLVGMVFLKGGSSGLIFRSLGREEGQRLPGALQVQGETNAAVWERQGKG